MFNTLVIKLDSPKSTLPSHNEIFFSQILTTKQTNACHKIIYVSHLKSATALVCKALDCLALPITVSHQALRSILDRVLDLCVTGHCFFPV